MRMTNPITGLPTAKPNYDRPTGRQVKMVQGARTPNTVAVAPVARSVVAILMGIPVPLEHMNGAYEMFLTDERFMYRNPTDALGIASDAYEVWETYKAENIDAQ